MTTMHLLPPVDDLDRPEPHDLDAEQAILGTALIAPKSTLDASQPLTPTDFHQPAHAIIWGAILARHEAGQQVDPITIAHHLDQQHDDTSRRSLLDHIGGRVYLAELVAHAGIPADAQAWADILRDHATRRRLLTAAARITAGIRAGSPITDTADRARADLDQATHAARREQPTTMAAVMELLPDTVGLPSTSGLATPWPDLDRLTGGMLPGTVTVVGARPGVGKSMLALNLASHIADHHHRQVMLCSLEMSAREIGVRRLSTASRINLSRLQRGPISDGERDHLASVATQLAASPLAVLDDPGITVGAIRDAARQMHRTHPLGCLIVDYVQLLTPERREQNREREVAEQSRRFKLLAMELDIPVVVLSQLNRALVGRADKRPELTDLRESGALEQDADVVWLLHHPDPMNATNLVLHVAKNRNGEPGTVDLLQQGWWARIVPISHREPAREYRENDGEE